MTTITTSAARAELRELASQDMIRWSEFKRMLRLARLVARREGTTRDAVMASVTERSA